MPRGPRLDAAGALHHVMARGLERRDIFRDDIDRADFVRRLAQTATSTATPVYAWALMPSHVHLLLRSGPHGLSAFMRRLLTGYCGTFNRRHGRVGHLLQNRYKSILVDEEPYFLELVRYIHLNPIRARIVEEFAELDSYPWAGHARILGTIVDGWQQVDDVLAYFGLQAGAAGIGYRNFVEQGVGQGQRPDLAGGGLRRSRHEWRRQPRLERGRERWTSDERVLGSSRFVERVLQECNPPGPQSTRECGLPERESKAAVLTTLERLVRDLGTPLGVSFREITSGSRRLAVCLVRAQVSDAALRQHGLAAPTIAHALGVSARSVLRAAARARNSKPAGSRKRSP